MTRHKIRDIDFTSMRLKAKIDTVCSRFGITHRMLAAALGVGPETLSRWKSGKLEASEIYVRIITRLEKESHEHEPGKPLDASKAPLLKMLVEMCDED